MKYLKLFEDIYIGNLTKEDKIELEEFCEDHLIYLLEEGFDLRVYINPNQNSMGIVLQNHEMLLTDLADYMAPFLTFLEKKYEIININEYFKLMGINDPNNPSDTDNIQFYFEDRATTFYTNISDIIDNKLEFNNIVSHVYMNVNKKESY